MPTLPPPSVPPVAICALTPITWPSSSSSGPPELPGLSAASVWIAPPSSEPSGACSVRSRRRHDAGGQRVVEAVGVADRVGVVADLDLVRVAERERLQAVGVDLEQREVVRRVGADDLGGELLAVGADLDRDLLGAVDDVLVRDDQAAVVDDEAGAGALALRGRGRDVGDASPGRPRRRPWPRCRRRRAASRRRREIGAARLPSSATAPITATPPPKANAEATVTPMSFVEFMAGEDEDAPRRAR